MTTLQAQNGWTRKAKSFYAQATLSNFSSKDYYSINGTLFNTGSTFKNSGLLLYGEYGLTDRFTLVFDMPLLVLNRFNTTKTVAGLGNATLGIKYGLFKKLPVSLQVDFEIPTDDGIKFSDAKEANELGIIEQINLPTSDGEFNIWTTLAVSQSLPNGKTFASLYSRVNFRTESFSHQFQAGLEVGHLFFDRLYLIGKLKIQEKLGGKDGEVNAGASFLYGEGTTFTSYGVTAMYNLNKQIKLVASVTDYGDFFTDRRNIYGGRTYTLGVAIEY
jgi:hypothetical protein